MKNIIWKSGVFLAMVMGLLISFVSPASAAHSNPQLQRGTIVLQVMKADPASTAASTVSAEVNYWSNLIPGNPFDMIQGSCFNGMPCFRVYYDHYGSMTFADNDAMTTHAAICGASYCNYDGTNATVTFLQFNLDLMGNYDATAKKSELCHEIGHGVSLEHTGGDTCMQAGGFSTLQYTRLSSAQQTEVYQLYADVAK